MPIATLLAPFAAEWRGLLPAFVAGLLLTLGFAPFGYWVVGLLAVTLLFYLWREATPTAAARLGFVFGLGQFGVGVSWVYIAIHVFGNTPAPIAALLTLIFCLFLALFPAAVGWLYRRYPARPTWLAAPLLASFWLSLEWVRSWMLTGFPWLNLGYLHTDSPLAGYAPIIGVMGLAWVTALTAAALVQWRRWVTLILVVLLWSGGVLLSGIHWSVPVGEPLRVSLIQGNVAQITKWDPQTYALRLQRYAEMTLAEVGRAELVVWPENAMTYFQHELQTDYLDVLQAKLAEQGGTLIAGLPILDANGEEYYTGLVDIGTNQRYTKRHLVPFGEFVPLGSLLRGLVEFFDLPMSGFSPGPEGQPPIEVAGQRLAGSVCYEDLFGNQVRQSTQEATLLLNGSNNAWYGDSLAPHQHLQVSRMRALENARPMLRATTNGISALIDVHGQVTARTRQFESETLRGEVQGYSGTTPYMRLGDWPVLLLSFSVVALVSLLRRRQG